MFTRCAILASVVLSLGFHVVDRIYAVDIVWESTCKTAASCNSSAPPGEGTCDVNGANLPNYTMNAYCKQIGNADVPCVTCNGSGTGKICVAHQGDHYNTSPPPCILADPPASLSCGKKVSGTCVPNGSVGGVTFCKCSSDQSPGDDCAFDKCK